MYVHKAEKVLTLSNTLDELRETSHGTSRVGVRGNAHGRVDPLCVT